MNQPLIESEKRDAKTMADLFRAMADTIELNGKGAFGGAFVIIPPLGDPHHTLILDAQQDAGQFWANIKTKADIALNTLQDTVRNQQAFRR